ncbi:hypothetical protein AB0D46_24885 [Streptomyces sp. NPDC048383]|uniref:hypothetical protein n=1 Tax=Streptomyces sp. NPDC048383 TaxID=3155386 RepID=UPI00342495D4
MSASLLSDLFWVHADPLDGLEHIYASCDVRGADLVMFFLRPRLALAEVAAEQLARRCLAGARQLTGWDVRRCGADLVPVLAERVLLSPGAAPVR